MNRKTSLFQQNEGQASLMIALMMATFLSFFAFVVNTGLLVNAKINLQNAADLAAYSGAATQARQLNNISFLNYEMRRQYKKFLFRYYVVGGFSQNGFPGPADDQGLSVFSPTGAISQGYRAPIVCINFSSSDNVCQLTEAPSIPQIENPGFLDTIGNILSDSLRQLEDIRQRNCGVVNLTNRLAMILWLANTVADLENASFFQNQGSTQAGQRVIQNLKGIANGIGLVPRQLILEARVNTLAEYVNIGPQSISQETISQLRNPNQTDVAKFERPIQAYLSAFNTLGEHTFDEDTIELEEMVPPEGGLLGLQPINVDFDALYLQMQPPLNDPGGCVSQAQFVGVKQMPVGFTKDPELATFYAVKLSADANLMFSPFGPIKLTAYSAAKPFGSRLGPADLTSNDFVKERNPSLLITLPGGGSLPTVTPSCEADTCRIPNVAMVEGDSSNEGWFRGPVLSGMLSSLSGNGLQNQVINARTLQFGYQTAMGPSQAELGKYNIPVDIVDSEGNVLPPVGRNGGDQMHTHFPGPAGSPTLIWAPIASEDNPQDLEQIFRNKIETSLADVASPALLDEFVVGFEDYLNQLQGGGGELGETRQLAAISNPLVLDRSLASAVGSQIVSSAGGSIQTNPLDIRTSHPSTRSSVQQAKGRVGYSVKFISFNHLLSSQDFPNSNRIPLTGQEDAELQDGGKLRH